MHTAQGGTDFDARASKASAGVSGHRPFVIQIQIQKGFINPVWGNSAPLKHCYNEETHEQYIQ